MLHVRFPYAKPLCGNGKALTRGEVLTGGKAGGGLPAGAEEADGEPPAGRAAG